MPPDDTSSPPGSVILHILCLSATVLHGLLPRCRPLRPALHGSSRWAGLHSMLARCGRVGSGLERPRSDCEGEPFRLLGRNGGVSFSSSSLFLAAGDKVLVMLSPPTPVESSTTSRSSLRPPPVWPAADPSGSVVSTGPVMDWLSMGVAHLHKLHISGLEADLCLLAF